MGPIFSAGIRRFVLVRNEDPSGISGTGIVACGAVFSDSQCVLKWLTHVNSLAIYPSIQALEIIHGHDGKTEVKWVDLLPGEHD